MATDWYSGWGWFLWYGMIILLFSSAGNWGYSYRTHRRYRDGLYTKDATDILNERYAKGELSREEFNLMKSEIQASRISADNNRAKKDEKFLRPQTSV